MEPYVNRQIGYPAKLKKKTPAWIAVTWLADGLSVISKANVAKDRNGMEE
jgi:hypothetical protein